MLCRSLLKEQMKKPFSTTTSRHTSVLHKLKMPRQSRNLHVPLTPQKCSHGTQRHRHAQEGHTCMRIPQALKQAYSRGYPESAMHVQRSIGSRNSAIHNDYHTSLRPSSVLEPRYPSLKVVKCKTLTWKGYD